VECGSGSLHTASLRCRDHPGRRYFYTVKRGR
jgi:hypothetical protein